MRGRKLCAFHNFAIHITVEIYPREGTETKGRRFGVLEIIWVEIYPREGTETFTTGGIRKSQFALKFIPVRGRKLYDGFSVQPPDLVEIYPREGTETCAACWRSPA